jgi:cholera toxin transcriptional activator
MRDVLGDSASNPKFIETIAKRGYRFLGTAEVIHDQSIAMSAKAPAMADVAQSSAAEPGMQPANVPAEADSGLPRVSLNTARMLFVLTQIMYLIFYLSALFRWENTYQASFNTWGRAGTVAFVVYLATALVGIAVRLYLISATAMDYHLLGEKYRILTPALFALDMLWALSPLLIADRIGLGFALGACAALVYMPFAQRTLMKMMQRQR